MEHQEFVQEVDKIFRQAANREINLSGLLFEYYKIRTGKYPNRAQALAIGITHTEYYRMKKKLDKQNHSDNVES